jgi:tripeptide aminopeptidase
MTNRIERIAQHPHVQNALAAFQAQLEQAVAQLIAVQQIPAPTFAEAERAAFVQEQFAAAGLQEVHQDGLHNVYGRYPAPGPTSHAPVIISAHTDTVFAADTDLTIQRDGRFLYGPGVGDNATGVAGLFLLAQALCAHQLYPPADLWFVANVGEEGLGNLRGMRAVVERFGRRATYIIVEGGLYGQISHQAIGVRRFRIEVSAPGGHSWGSFGAPSAIHQLAHIIAAIDRLRVPEQPKTTFNVGIIQGGTSINTIAQAAHLLLDLRSEEPAALAELEAAVAEIVTQVARPEGRANGVSATMTLVGDRPAGHIPRHTPLVSWAEAALRAVGCHPVIYMAGSTDANIPLSQGITAVCVGLTRSGNAHRLDEYIEPGFLPDGLGQLLLLTLAAAGF